MAPRCLGNPGRFTLRLAQRLLDPVAAGNHKLQTLRQYYRLPERGAHTALGDVETVIDLMRNVLRPIAEQRGLHSIEQVQALARETWFPSRIAFGKFKGRYYRDAVKDTQLRGWLKWLASSSNSRSAEMGRWYLKQIKKLDQSDQNGIICEPTGTGLTIYSSPEVEVLRRLIDAARIRLAELEAELTQSQHAVANVQAQLFEVLRSVYERRDQLVIVVRYRRQYLDTLLQVGEEEASKTSEQYQQARRDNEREYEDTAKLYGDKGEALSEEEHGELRRLWKKLVGLYHPDRYQNDKEKQAVYDYLTSEINRARDQGDIKRLREIAEDPNGFLLGQGKSSLFFGDDGEDVQKLRELHDSLQAQIMAVIESIEALKVGAEHELYQYSLRNPDWLEDTAKAHADALEKEIMALEEEAAALATEIEDLAGDKAF